MEPVKVKIRVMSLERRLGVEGGESSLAWRECQHRRPAAVSHRFVEVSVSERSGH